ncbi:hypothetical protein [Amycolatopsis aidingensis]|uniref:hypothetical protein n=1 Tax=Amycolatopsis aidingensis TaxID=2842453 RepID=UPI001C0BC799|nr:hypothetical protein [Amycolatopsis aidingensis]
MRQDWIFQAVQAEVAYRTEELRKAAGIRWPGRAARRRRGANAPAQPVRVPRQRGGEHEATGQRARAC